MKRYPRIAWQRQGAALMVTLFLLAVFSISSGALLRHLHLRLDESARHGRDVTAYYLAEAGVEKAIAMLQQAETGYRGEHLSALGEGYYTVTVTADADTRRYTIHARGLLLTEDIGGTFPLEQRIRGEATIRAELQLDAQGTVTQLYWTLNDE